MDVNNETDLPLTANVNEIRARHYLLKLAHEPDIKTFKCESVIFFQPVKCDNDSGSRLRDKHGEFECILDCCDMNIHDVKEAVLPGNYNQRQPLPKSPEFLNGCLHLSAAHGKDLHYTLDDWSVRVRKPGCVNSDEFPRAVYFKFSTRPTSRSVMWRSDARGQPCVFTAASNINNRGLFPCQEPPIAMADWRCVIEAEPGLTVLCTGDEDATTTKASFSHLGN